jgi:predicted dehydrogenase
MGVARGAWLAGPGGCEILILDPVHEARVKFLTNVPRSSAVTSVAQAREAGASAAFVSVAPSLHFQYAIECIKNGLPVFIEKPSTLEAHEGEELLRAGRESRLPVIVGYHNRVRSSVVALRTYLSTHRAFGFTAWWVCTPYARDWWLNRSESGGGFFEQGCHLVDLICLLLGECNDVQRMLIFQEGSSVESAALVLKFRSACVGTIFYSSCAPEKDISIRLFTESGVVRLEGWNFDFLINNILVESGLHSDSRDEPFHLECNEFLLRLQGRPPNLPLATLEDAIKTESIVRSIRARNA